MHKLHGSIDWLDYDSGNEQILVRTTSFPPNNLSQYSKSFKDANYAPALIFGKVDKLRPEGIYLDLLVRFNETLNRNKYLCVIGYSFRDPHINRFISRWLIENPDAIMCIVTPGTTDLLHNLSSGALNLRAHNPIIRRYFIVKSTTAELFQSYKFKHEGEVELNDDTRWMSIEDIKVT